MRVVSTVRAPANAPRYTQTHTHTLGFERDGRRRISTTNFVRWRCVRTLLVSNLTIALPTLDCAQLRRYQQGGRRCQVLRCLLIARLPWMEYVHSTKKTLYP